MKVADSWKTYRILATGDGEKLEDWNGVKLLRPDPQVIWHAKIKMSDRADAVYQRSGGGGKWTFKKNLPQQWTVEWQGLKFVVKPMGFKHTGIFPEQAVNWERMGQLIKSCGRQIRLLNLFAYTGGASVACAKAGALVTHVDASKGMVDRAKENAKLNGISDIRFIVDDCEKFLKREIRRGNRYDAIILDPPSYGRGPNGEMWKLENDIADFMQVCKEVLSDNPLFVLFNSYTTGLQPTVIANILKSTFGMQNVEADEIGLPTDEGLILPCGASGVKIWKN